ncbi:putative phage abortive infection protein [Vibrio parahaemolyticus]|nr:putative phage abortive infection protein [Vibrio parahaemolyticus]HCH6158777.1 putative phage abortive infection protein [Vibrio parahaemolyticus]
MRYKFLIGVFSIFAFAILLLYVIQFHGGLSDSHTSWGEFGSFFGGILSPIVSILAFIGLLYSMDQTKMQFKQQSEENSFYALLNFHHSKVSQTTYESYLGLDAFKALSGDFFELYEEYCFDIAKRKIQEEPTQLPEYSYHFLSEVIKERSALVEGNGKNLVEYYFSLSKDKNELFKGLFDANISESDKRKLVAIGDTLVRQLRSNERLGLIGKIYDDFYHNHGHILGHYFRNLYYTLEVADSSCRYDAYANILRAQLSRYELNLLFYNSVSSYSSEKFNRLLGKYNMLNGLYNWDVCYKPESEGLQDDLASVELSNANKQFKSDS